MTFKNLAFKHDVLIYRIYLIFLLEKKSLTLACLYFYIKQWPQYPRIFKLGTGTHTSRPNLQWRCILQFFCLNIICVVMIFTLMAKEGPLCYRNVMVEWSARLHSYDVLGSVLDSQIAMLSGAFLVSVVISTTLFQTIHWGLSLKHVR